MRREYPDISDVQAHRIAVDIEKSLTDYFRRFGLSLATTLYASQSHSTKVIVPESVLPFIKDASARYDELSIRQAFWKASVDAFVHPETVQRTYLGRIAQGFFAFHMLGMFGEVAKETFDNARQSLWLIDSNAQIPALALGASTNRLFHSTFSRLKHMGIRLFTTENLFEESYWHLNFAKKFIADQGVNSHLLLAAAAGQPPYRKANQFLEGFVNWQAAGNPNDWLAYLHNAFDNFAPSRKDMKIALEKLGIEVVAFDNWLGFEQQDFNLRDQYTQELQDIWQDKERSHWWETEEELIKKLAPEAEAFIIIDNEQSGRYKMLPNKSVSARFISNTAILNLLNSNNQRVTTWKTEGFVRFVSTLLITPDSESDEIAFETILWNIAQSGINILDESVARVMFGGVIDQAKLPLTEHAVQQLYNEGLSKTYGESIESVLARISEKDQAIAAIQLANQIAQTEADRAAAAQRQVVSTTAQLTKTQSKLDYANKKLDSKRRRLGKKSKKKKGQHK